MHYLGSPSKRRRAYMGGPVGYVTFTSPDHRLVTFFFDHHTTIGPFLEIARSQTTAAAAAVVQGVRRRCAVATAATTTANTGNTGTATANTVTATTTANTDTGTGTGTATTANTNTGTGTGTATTANTDTDTSTGTTAATNTDTSTGSTATLPPLILCVENMEETEEFGLCMRHVMQNAPVLSGTAQRVRFLQLLTRENIFGGVPEKHVVLRSIEERGALCLADRYWANRENPIVISPETSALIETLLTNVTLQTLCDNAITKLNNYIQNFSEKSKKKTTTTIQNDNSKNPFLEIQRKIIRIFDDLRNFLGEDTGVMETPLCKISGDILKKLRGWSLYDLDSDLIYQLVDAMALDIALHSEGDVVVFVGSCHAEVLVEYLEKWVVGWKVVGRMVPGELEMERDDVKLLEDDVLVGLILNCGK